MLRFRLFKNTIKKFIKMTPVALIGTFAPLLIIGVLFWYTAGNLYDVKDTSIASVGIVMEDIEDSWYNRALSYLGDMDSTENTVTFEKYEDMDHAMKALNNSDIVAIIYFPANIVDSIMYGENIPATITFPKNVNIATVNFSEITKAGAEFLSAAQAGTYTAADLYSSVDSYNLIDDAYTNIDIINFSYVLSRENLFLIEETDLTNNVNTFTFYIASALMILTLFLGVSYNKALRTDDKSFIALLKSNRVSVHTLTVYKCISFAFLIFVLLSLITVILSFIKNETFSELFNISYNLNAIVSFLIISVFVATYTLLIFQLSSKISGSILMLFILGTIMTILSGAVIPKVFFPDALSEIGSKLPTASIHQLMINVFTGNSNSSGPIVILLIYSIVFLTITLLIEETKVRRFKI